VVSFEQIPSLLPLSLLPSAIVLVDSAITQNSGRISTWNMKLVVPHDPFAFQSDLIKSNYFKLPLISIATAFSAKVSTSLNLTVDVDSLI
jgi:hypothetical protein